MDGHRYKGAEKTHPEIENQEIMYKIRYRKRKMSIFCHWDCECIQVVMKLIFEPKSTRMPE